MMYFRFFPVLILLLFLFHQTAAANSDSTSRQCLIGFDVFKNVSMNRYQPGRTGYHLEILVKPRFEVPLHPYFGIGIGKSSTSKLFTNTSLETNGIFIKGGAETLIGGQDRFRVFLGAGLLFSAGHYKARFVIPGNFFPDVVETSDRRENRIALQTNVAFSYSLFRQLECAILLNGTIFLKPIPENTKSHPSWYTPGVGYHRTFPLYPDIIVQLFYNLRTR
jgi:hypothetical protein